MHLKAGPPQSLASRVKRLQDDGQKQAHVRLCSLQALLAVQHLYTGFGLDAAPA